MFCSGGRAGGPTCYTFEVLGFSRHPPPRAFIVASLPMVVICSVFCVEALRCAGLSMFLLFAAGVNRACFLFFVLHKCHISCSVCLHGAGGGIGTTAGPV